MSLTANSHDIVPLDPDHGPAGDPADFCLGVQHSALGRPWRRNCTGAAQARTAAVLARELGLSDGLAAVLAARGVTPDTANTFLTPKLKTALPDPSHFRDMDTAASRLADAVMGGEKCAVFGDYDVDGATSSALLFHYFRALGHPLTIYIPDRIREGYGPNAAALEGLAGSGHSLCLTVDCGSLAFGPLEAAQAAGLDVIVVDHHQAKPNLPPAAAIVNPNRLDCLSGCGQLAAVGVVFMVLIALNRELRRRGYFTTSRPEPDLRAWLDIVALGTVCDVVPLTGVNRALVSAGLQALNQRRNPGLAALAEAAGTHGPVTPMTLGFGFGPRINAGGRIGAPDLGVRLLTASPDEAPALARQLDQLNRARREVESDVLDAAMAQARAALDRDDPAVLCVGAEGWHPGVIGIVASRLKEAFGRPCVVIGWDGETGKGSGRSVPGADLGAAVLAAYGDGLVLGGGGHAMAAGCSIARGQFAGFARFLNARLAEDVAAAQAAAGCEIDTVIAPEGATAELLAELHRAAPFGAGNREPMVAISGAQLRSVHPVGTGHFRCRITSARGAGLKGVAFRCGPGSGREALAELLRSGAPVHLAGRLREDRYQGRFGVEFHIEDAAPA